MREILKGFNMKYRFKTTKDLEGCYLASVWNGMRDIYIKATRKIKHLSVLDMNCN